MKIDSSVTSIITALLISVSPTITTAADFDDRTGSNYDLPERILPPPIHSGLKQKARPDAQTTRVKSYDARAPWLDLRQYKKPDSFSEFLSYPVGKKATIKTTSDYKIFAGEGADLGDINDPVYVGLSANIRKKWMIRFGGAYGSVTSGMHEAMHTAPGPAPIRPRHGLIDKDRKWVSFVSISMRF